MPVTSTSRPPGLRFAIASALIFALWRPYGRISSGPRPTSAATSAMGRSLAAWAMAISDGTVVTGCDSPLWRNESEPEAEHARGILSGARDHLVGRQAPHRGDPLRHLPDEGGLVALAAMRDGREIGPVGLDQQPVERCLEDGMVQ